MIALGLAVQLQKLQLTCLGHFVRRHAPVQRGFIFEGKEVKSGETTTYGEMVGCENSPSPERVHVDADSGTRSPLAVKASSRPEMW